MGALSDFMPGERIGRDSKGEWRRWDELTTEEQEIQTALNEADRYVEERKQMGTVTKTDLSSALLDRAWRRYGIN